MQLDYRFNPPILLAQHPNSLELLLNFQAIMPEKPQRLPLNLSIVIDRSGSMAGQPLKQAIAAAKLLVTQLMATDILSIVIYDDQVETLLEPQPLTDKDHAHRVLSRISAAGCTNLSGGWLKGCELVKRHATAHCLNRVLLLTDGQANVGVKDSKVLIEAAQQKQREGISTTTLGFGNHFNEDLLIGMAQAGAGNFYFIQSADDMTAVFRIELESLGTIAAKDLMVRLQPAPGVTINAVLNPYPHQMTPHGVEIQLGDVYAHEAKSLALDLTVTAGTGSSQPVLTCQFQYQALEPQTSPTFNAPQALHLAVGDLEAVSRTPADIGVVTQTSRLRIARAKEAAVTLADQGQYQPAAANLRTLLAQLKQTPLAETFEMAEEIEQLGYYAQQLDKQQLGNDLRKEMRDQSYQSLRRNRDDLTLRGTSSGSAENLAATDDAGQGVVLQCIKENGKLRMKITTVGYNPDFNVQFPRDLREEGISYVVDAVELSTNGSFYRVNGTIRRLNIPGQVYASKKTRTRGTNPTAKPLSNKLTAAALEITDTVGQGVLVQCVAEGKKLRARVVSDGYNPDFNMMFPRSIRELGVLYVVDEVRENPKGGSYIAYGKIKRLRQ
jgi:Ca-activated chloride channel family protein